MNFDISATPHDGNFTGKRIPVSQPSQYSGLRTATGNALPLVPPDTLSGTNRKILTDSQSVSAGDSVPPGQDTALPLYHKALKSLEKRIRGYLLKEVKTIYEYDTDGNKRIKNETITRKQVAPDLAAITFTLSNLDPQRWRAKSSAGAENPSGENDPDDDCPDLSQLSEQTLREISGLSEP